VSGAAPAQPAPSGMRRIPLPLESYALPSAPLSSKRLVNLYPEQEPADARSAAALIPTPGLGATASFGTGPILAINGDMPGFLYLVSGSHLWRIGRSLGAGGPEDLGEIGSPEPIFGGYARDVMATIAVSPVGAVVCVPPNAYTCTHTGALNLIGGDFPGATSVAELDGYFVFTSAEVSSRFFLSRLLDPTAFDALDFAYADTIPNVVRRVVAYRGDVWLAGEAGMEAWYDSGDADFPFRRRPGAFIPLGVAGPKTLAWGDGSLWWLGMDGNVYRTVGYQAQRISTHGIEALIAAAADGSGVTTATDGLFYTQGGHSFYALSFPANTIVYDCNTKAWHERASGLGGTGRWRAACVSSNITYPIFGDSLSGSLMTTGVGYPVDMGVPQTRIAVLPPLWGGTRRAFCARLEIEMEVGTALAGPVTLDWSDDGGTTFSAARILSVGPYGQLRRRVFTTRLGSFRQRVFRIETTAASTIYAIDADLSGGAS
jgi:hypothetical protein